jgi:DNA polymerase
MFPQIITHANRRVVENQQPVVAPNAQRIAIVGEAPGEQEENYGIPFVGASGQLLDRTLSDVGISRQQCFVGNICRVRPPGNDINRFPWDGEEIQSGLARLRLDLGTFNPNIVVLLGNAALRAAGKDGKISEWRGSLFESTSLDGVAPQMY